MPLNLSCCFREKWLCVFLCIQANIIRGTSIVMVTFPYTFQLVCVFLKVDWVFSYVICEVFDGVVQITGESKGKRIFWRSQTWLFILLSDPICCHSNRFLLTPVMGWFVSICSEFSFDWGAAPTASRQFQALWSSAEGPQAQTPMSERI